MATVSASVAKTRRCVIVDEGWKAGSLSAEVTARLVEDSFFELDAPIRRVCSREIPPSDASQQVITSEPEPVQEPIAESETKSEGE